MKAILRREQKLGYSFCKNCEEWKEKKEKCTKKSLSWRLFSFVHVGRKSWKSWNLELGQLSFLCCWIPRYSISGDLKTWWRVTILSKQQEIRVSDRTPVGFYYIPFAVIMKVFVFEELYWQSRKGKYVEK